MIIVKWLIVSAARLIRHCQHIESLSVRRPNVNKAYIQNDGSDRERVHLGIKQADRDLNSIYLNMLQSFQMKTQQKVE